MFINLRLMLYLIVLTLHMKTDYFTLIYTPVIKMKVFIYYTVSSVCYKND